MAVLRTWTLALSRQYLVPRPTGTTMHSLDPTEPDPPMHWWGGEGTLHFEGLDWSGAQMADGMLMAMGPIGSTPNLNEGTVTARLALAEPVLRRQQQMDPGTLHVEIGWIRNPHYGRPDAWRRIDRYHRGRMGRRVIRGNVMEITIEQYWVQVDRGRTTYVTAADYPQMPALHQGIVRNFPQFH